MTLANKVTFSREGAVVCRSREIVRQQLEPGEHLIKFVIGKMHVSLDTLGPIDVFAGIGTPWYCLALINSGLLLIGLDSLWKPIIVRRIEFSKIRTASCKNGWLTSRLRLDFHEDKPLDLEIVHSFQKQAQAIVSVFNKHWFDKS